MEVTYIKKLNASYLEISGMDEDVDICGERMLLGNRIYGLLPMNTAGINENRIYQYDITGRQALDVLLEHKQIDEHMLVGLLAGICGIAERLENYLLLENRLLLSPEFIFRDYETGEFWFCYYPGNMSETEYTFQRLTEYLLTKIDHKEERAVQIAYCIYEEVLKDRYSLSGIREKISFFKVSEEVSIEKEEYIPDEFGEELVEKPTEKLIGDKVKKHTIEKKSIKESTNIGRQNEKEDGIWQRWKSIIPSVKPAVEGVFNFSSFFKNITPQKKKEPEPEPFVFEPEQEEVRQGRPTTLLMTKSGEAEGILKYIGDNQLPDFKIEDLPFLIGSDESCDGILEAKTISRMHARITKLENTYYIEDLNSSNGTRVGGEELSYKKKVPLITNEIIEFADEKFKFI